MRGRNHERMPLRGEAPKHAPSASGPTEVEGAGGAWLRCRWAVAGPGRASRRRAERSSRRGRLAGGPPPTGTQSSPAPQQGTTVPGTPAVLQATSRAGRRPPTRQTARPHSKARRRPEQPRGQRGDGASQAERPASSVARCTPLRPASCAAWVRHEKPSARYTASGCASSVGSSE